MSYVVKELGLSWISIRTGQILDDKDKEEAERIKYKLELQRVDREIANTQAEFARVNKEMWPDVNAQLVKLDQLKDREHELTILFGYLKVNPWVQQRPAKGVIFYSGGGYFDYFYGRHAARTIGNGTASVLVVGLDGIPSAPDVEEALRLAMFGFTLQKGVVNCYVGVPQIVEDLGVREWDFVKKIFLTDWVQGYFVSRDITKIEDLSQLNYAVEEQKLTASEILEVDNLMKVSKAPGYPRYPYIVKYVFFVDKYFVSRTKKF